MGKVSSQLLNEMDNKISHSPLYILAKAGTTMKKDCIRAIIVGTLKILGQMKATSLLGKENLHN